MPLPAPVLSLRMRSSAITPLELRPGTLAVETDRDADPEAAARLLERLRARLGGDAVFSIRLVPEHRPELAWGIAEPTLAATDRCNRPDGRAPPERATFTGASEAGGTTGRRRSRQAHPAGAVVRRAWEAPLAPRPLWMLADPQRLPDQAGVPLHDGSPLDLASGPERIETGWWDGRDIRRDYYVATTQNGVRLWIYRERARDGDWWLHGVFG
jgi:protein ImuB